MRYLIWIIVVILFIIFCLSENDMEKLFIIVKEILDNWLILVWGYDIMSNVVLFKFVLDFFLGRYLLLMVKDGKIIFEYY